MDKVILSLRKKVDAYKLPDTLEEIPSYASLKMSKEELYSYYSNTVTLYNRTCESLGNLQYTLVSIDRMLRELTNSKEVFTVQKYQSTELKNLKDEVQGIVNAYKTRKEGLESAVKFYNSVQYLLNSYRLEDC